MRRELFRCVLFITAMCMVSVTAVAQTPIGSITETSGLVEIDAFGAGTFVKTVVPEAIYATTVIRTDYESWAYLSIDGNSFTVGPNSTTPVSTFVSERRRGRGEGFFARVLRELTRSLTPPEDDVLIAGGRAAEVAGPTTEWVFDVDPDELYTLALHQLEEGRFEPAVDSLRLIEFPEDGSFEIEEYYVNLVYALMGMGDFHAAMAASFEYLLEDPEPEKVSLMPQRLQLLAGISAYYASEDEIARASIDAYLEGEPLDRAATEAIAVRYNLLIEDGRRNEAERFLQQARRAQPEVDWDSLIQ